jgi:hypothetical protein
LQAEFVELVNEPVGEADLAESMRRVQRMASEGPPPGPPPGTIQVALQLRRGLGTRGGCCVCERGRALCGARAVCEGGMCAQDERGWTRVC